MTWLVWLVLGTLFGAVTPHDGSDERGWNFNTRVRDGQPLTSCSQVEVSVRGGQLARGEDAATVPTTSNGLSVTGFKNGGLYARGGGASEYAVKLCKFAAGDTLAEAQSVLEQVRLSVRGGVVSVDGPTDRQAWTAHLIVMTPQDAHVNLETLNGPLSVDGIAGYISVRATNGPVSVQHCNGEIHIEATNGPVDLMETNGDVHINASNGPLTVALSGQSWDGAGLEGRASNGPLTLRVPDGYQSGVQVEMSRHSPLSCRAAICSDAVRLGGENNGTLRLGAPDAQVRLSAYNGPVSIRSGHEE